MVASFNLIDEPWIIATDLDGTSREYSISEILSSAAELATIGGDIPTQEFATTRVLLAIIRRAIDWGESPLEVWEQFWKRGDLPVDQINAYLDTVRSRFDLLDPQKPFYQVPDFQSSGDSFRPVGLLVSDVPPKYQYFTTRAGSGATDLSLAEAARWIVHTQAYDPSGIKTGDKRDPRTKGGKGYPIGIAWAGQLGGVLVQTRTLARTLLLNLSLVVDGETTVVAGDRPAWEQDHPTVGAREHPEPMGPLDLLTWQSRRMCVRYESGRATGVIVGNGNPIEAFNRFQLELWSPWRYSEIQSKKAGQPRFYPRIFDPSRAVWRGLESLLLDASDDSAGIRAGRAPGVVKWIDLLAEQQILDSDDLIVVHVYGMRYDSQASVIGASVDDTLDMRIASFSSYELRRRACDAADTAERITRAVGSLASDLARAAGGEGDGDRDRAAVRFLSAVDHPFRMWLVRLGVDDTDRLVVAWHRQLYQLAGDHSAQLIRESGRPAFVGRTVKDNKGHEWWLDAAHAELTFRKTRRRELPEAFTNTEGESDDTAGE